MGDGSRDQMRSHREGDESSPVKALCECYVHDVLQEGLNEAQHTFFSFRVNALASGTFAGCANWMLLCQPSSFWGVLFCLQGAVTVLTHVLLTSKRCFLLHRHGFKTPTTFVVSSMFYGDVTMTMTKWRTSSKINFLFFFFDTCPLYLE